MNKSKAMRLVRKHSFLCDHKDDPRAVIDVDDVELIINAMQGGGVVLEGSAATGWDVVPDTMPEESAWDIIQQYRSNKQQGLMDELRHMENQIAKRKIEEWEQNIYDTVRLEIANEIKDWLDREEE